jgi:anion-transporting  ArsA/GET3 family ATPase
VDPARFFAASRLVIVAGKGGVGKTTVSGVLARAAARTGRDTTILEVDGKSGLAGLFDAEALGYEPGGLAEGVRGRALTADDALVEYLDEHGMARLSRRLVRSGALDVVSTAAPGIEDILLLGKVKQIERDDSEDLLVLDAPAAGHAISFLRAPAALLETVSSGPINTQATDALEMLRDPARTRVVLVTVPEETPVNELIETAYRLEDEVGVALGPVVVNGVQSTLVVPDVDPVEAAESVGVSLTADEAEALRQAAAFGRARAALQQEQLDRLATSLPLPQIRLPELPALTLGPHEVDVLAAALLDGVAGLPEATVAP